MGVEPQHADLDRLARWPRMLKASDEPRHRRARGKQTDGEVTVTLVLRDDVGEVAERHAELLPGAVFGGFVGGERCFLDADRCAKASELLLDAPAGHRRRSDGRASR